MTQHDPYRIGIVAYDQVDLLDVSVPYELFNWMAIVEADEKPKPPKREVSIVSLDGPAITTRDGLKLGGDFHTLAATDRFDLLWIAGGDPERLQALMLSETQMDILREVGTNTDLTASVCEGALLAAAAGLLDGHRATTHWAFIPCLKMFPKVEVVAGYPRYVPSGNRITGGGISSGLDEALFIISQIANPTIAGKVQLNVQYHPEPPFNDGDPSVAKPPVYTPGDGDTCDFPGMCAAIDKVLSRQR